MPNRVIAYIIDAIILFVIFLVVNIVLGGILPRATVVADPNNPLGFRVDQPIVTILIFALLNFAITAAYFVYSWTAMRGSPGMKVLGMQIGSERDGSTITINQAFMRFLFLGAPFGIAQALTGISSLGIIIVIATIAYFIFLLVTTAQSPTKQGFHDKQAHTMVVKAARSVA
ncbi:MAG: RDD family protein [Chloroflexi bacterium]|nr:RDD family protein [Chloroflexota bacterium]